MARPRYLASLATGAILALCAALPVPARADCEARVEASRFINFRPIDVFAATGEVEPLDIVVTREDSSAACDYLLTLSRNDEPLLGGSAGRHALHYVLARQPFLGARLRDARDSLPQEGIALRMSQNQASTQVSLFALTSIGELVSEGAYSGAFDIQLYDVAQGIRSLIDTETVRVNASVPGRASIGVSTGRSSGGELASSAKLDFGELEAGERQTLFVYLRSNSNVRLSVDSEHDGVLVHEADETQRVPFNASFDGRTVDMKLESKFEISRDEATAAHPLAFTIGQIQGKRAGTYRDTIYLHVSPVE